LQQFQFYMFSHKIYIFVCRCLLDYVELLAIVVVKQTDDALKLCELVHLGET
jgi:hypothetical protein